MNNGFNIAKYNDEGEQIWKQKLKVNDTTDFIAQKFISIGSDYYISGFWGEFNNRCFGLMKTDSTGNKLYLSSLFQNKNKQKGFLLVNPEILMVEKKNILLSHEYKDNIFITKLDSSCNIIWQLTEKELEYEGRYIPIKLVNTNDKFVCFLDWYFWEINFDGEIINKDSLGGGYHNNIVFGKDKYFACGSDNPKLWVRGYSLEFNLEEEYIQPENQNQRLISGAASIVELKDKSVLTYYDFYYDGTGLGDIHYNIQLLHLNSDLNCKSTINLYAYGSQYANKLLIDKSGDYILFGHGYHEYYNRDMLLLVKMKKWPLGSNNIESEAAYSISPNPTSNNVTLTLNKAQSGDVHIYNTDGKILIAQPVYNQKNISINLENQPNGILLLKFFNDKDVFTRKIIKS